jgi:uncharacterized damage-inducible protein DinB
MAEQRTLEQMLADVRQSQRDFLAILSKVDERTLYTRPSENEWSIAEILVHVANAREFFTAETEKVLATPGVTMGRTIVDPERIQYVCDHAHDSADLIERQLVTSHEYLVSLLERMHDDDLAIVGKHVKFGEQTLSEFIEHFIVEHDQAHVRQSTALVS